MTVSVTAKSRTLTNGTANDATSPEASFVELYNNDSTLATALNLILGTTATNSAVDGLFLTLRSTYASAPGSTDHAGLIIERGSSTNVSLRWNETTDKFQVTENGTDYYDIVNSGSTDLAYPLRYHGSAKPVYASTTTFTVANIAERNSANDGNIVKSTSTTVDIATTGINGVTLGSANLTGTITITTNTTVSGTSTTFTTDFQVGDAIRSNGGQVRRITNIGDNTTMTVDSAWSSGETTVAYKRGGRAPNTWYHLYAITDGTTPGLILSTRNVAGSDTLVDLPSGYTKSRQLPYSVVLNTSSVMIPHRVTAGWPHCPTILYNVTITSGTTDSSLTTVVLHTGGATSATDVNCSGFIPKTSKEGIFYLSTDRAILMHLNANGSSDIIAYKFGASETKEQIRCATDANQVIEYYFSGTAQGQINVQGFVVDQVN